MYIEFTTTITHRIKIGDDGFEAVEHTADVDAGEVSFLPSNTILMIAADGAKKTLRALEQAKGDEA